ncbi:alpha/beta fold hydrolase [Actinophytocola sp. NPDC049390]|uniref:alpha/beta fold hydrolase n=1 Tax=Actinophytocola sp. NPDC049390 TaxID=3363894 RepID=UPI00379294F7
MTSPDGTVLAYTREGEGPAVVLVGGGLDDGAENASLATALSRWFTVYNYARRGRGGSGDTQPYALEREVEDLATLIEAAGGTAHVHGVSSGGALALRAAAAGLPIDRLSVYEVPYAVGEAAAVGWREYVTQLDAALAMDDRDAALRLFMRLAGSGEDDITAAAGSPMWPGLLKIAHTLGYDAACLGDGTPPAAELARITQPTLVATGGVPDPHMSGLRPGYFDAAADAIAALVPNATRKVVAGQSHVADPATISVVLKDFFTG